MVNDFLIHLSDQYGYFIFYAALSLGPFGLPLPCEVIVTTSGWISGNGRLDPRIVYLCVAAGMITAATAAFWLGACLGEPLVEKLRKHRIYSRYIAAAERLLRSCGDIALFVGYFIPIVRYLVPLMAGAGRIPFRKFAAISYSGAVAWTLCFFGIGYYTRTEWAEAAAKLPPGMEFIPCMAAALGLVTGYCRRRLAIRQEGESQHECRNSI